jgi:tRNA (guanosine-2'-O-)-methyltransferase
MHHAPFFLHPMEDSLVSYLSQFVNEGRLTQFEKKLLYRTRYLTVVLEDIFQPHNASAVLRSCECFGIQDIHIIENSNEYRISPDVALGSHKWLTMNRYNSAANNTPEAIDLLRKEGYRIVAATPHKHDCNLEDFDLAKGKTALVFGSELNGLSDMAMNMADEYLKIPTVGFTESLNISVSAAICLHYLSLRLRQSNLPWPLSASEKQSVKLSWLRNSIKKVELIERTFFENHPL